MSDLKRRDILKIGALAAAGTGLGFPAILRAQSREIVILGLWDQTGAFSDVGPLNDRGMMMALEERDMKARRWQLLVADYAFGWSVEKYVKEVGKAHGIEFVGADRHPLGEREFSNYVQKAAANRPDVVAMINFGGDAVAGAREIFNFGLTPKIPLIMCWSSGVEELIQLAPEIRDNLWVGTNFYYTVDTPAAKAFVREYQAKFKLPPGYAPSAAYSMTHMLLASFDKARSDDVQAEVKGAEGAR